MRKKTSFLDFLSTNIYNSSFDFTALKNFNFKEWDMSNIMQDGWCVNPLDYCFFHQIDLTQEQWNYLIELFCTTHQHQHENNQDGNTFLTIIGRSAPQFKKFTSEQYLRIMSVCYIEREDMFNCNCLYYLLMRAQENDFEPLRPALDRAIDFFFCAENAHEFASEDPKDIDITKPLCSTYDNINILFNEQFSSTLPYAMSKIKDIDWLIAYVENHKKDTQHIQKNPCFIAFKERIKLNSNLYAPEKTKILKL